MIAENSLRSSRSMMPKFCSASSGDDVTVVEGDRCLKHQKEGKTTR